MRGVEEARKDSLITDQQGLDLAVPRMVSGRVRLIGDAAFIPRPHTAVSTSKAAANAVALGDAWSLDIFKSALASNFLSLSETLSEALSK